MSQDIVVFETDGACRFAKRVGSPVIKLGDLAAL